ncbi:MAG TPA: fasciclin domain-containing protein [Anaerolineae bacterium]|jgi:transforming growth factor-beta-induced protein|nr:fasciclin domain-containing protein [Anaerolineae bacterium]
MKSVKVVILAALVFVLVFVVASASADPVQRFKPGDDTIATIAVENGSFTTLVEALICTDLVGAVANEDAELTVFAPTDAAFAGLGLNAGNICDDAVIDKDMLTTVLLYHVVGERRPSPSVINGQNKSIWMLAGGAINPEGKGSLALFDNNDRQTNIVVPDVMASNGIIHVVNNVLLP